MGETTIWDRFNECRVLGLPGIPHAELHYYLVDVARELDVLREDGRQHGNVTPATIHLSKGAATVCDPDTEIRLIEGKFINLSDAVTTVYGAPEQFQGKVSLNSDQYALANVYQELLTGIRPLGGSSLQELLTQHLNGTPDVSPLPEGDQPIVARALSKKPEERYPSCTEFVRELREAITPAERDAVKLALKVLKQHPVSLLMGQASLAQPTLWDRFKECRELGLPGIPRIELLNYMSEAAEALDLMNMQYQIQHLDIKPQNLLLVFNHVKIADFGLGKVLEGAQATVTGGVTPVYAAPETFEGSISRFSDQYSLAIVFQELLTGHRPFNGTNTRQLLMQHMNGTPNLSPLPVCDQPIVGRALSKKPDDRYPSCGAFVNELRRATDEPLLELSRE